MAKRTIGWTLLILGWGACVLHLRNILLPPDVLSGGMGNGMTAVDFLVAGVGKVTYMVGILIILLSISALIYMMLIKNRSSEKTLTKGKRISLFFAKWGLCLILAITGFFALETLLQLRRLGNFFASQNLWISEGVLAFAVVVILAGIYVLLRKRDSNGFAQT